MLWLANRQGTGKEKKKEKKKKMAQFWPWKKISMFGEKPTWDRMPKSLIVYDCL